MPGKILIFAVALMILSAAASGRILHVPTDFPTIQAGIDATLNGDTVLVKPGTYHENINFCGKNIVVGSRFLTSGNPDFISSTIIDGDSTGSVVTFNSGEDSTAMIIGFSITDGFALLGGGIFCDGSSPTICHNEILLNVAGGEGIDKGAGIFCRNSATKIKFNNIHNNRLCQFGSDIFRGGGICGDTSDLLIIGNDIYNNMACTGGGIGGEYSIFRIFHNNIYDNFAVM